MHWKKRSNSLPISLQDIDTQTSRIHTLLRSGRETSAANSTYINQIIVILKTHAAATPEFTYWKARLDECLSLFAPIRKLPSEILSEIFTLAVYSSSRPGQMPWKIAAVCSYWRTVSLGIPQIWTVVPLTMDLEHDDDEDIGDALDRVDVLLSRSNKSPLTLDLTIKQNFEEDWDIGDDYDIFLATLKTQVHRWRHLKIQYRCTKYHQYDDSSSSPAPTLLYRFIHSGAPHIHSLDLDVSELAAEFFVDMLDSLSAPRSPGLRTLRLVHRSRYISPHILADSSLPFNQLTNLNVKVTSTAAVLMLKLCPNLISAKFVVPAAAEPLYFLANYSEDDLNFQVMTAMEAKVKELTLADDFHRREDLLSCGLEHEATVQHPYVRPRLRSLTLRVFKNTVSSGQTPFITFCRILGAVTCPSLSSLSLISDAHKGYFPNDHGSTGDNSTGGLLVAINFLLLRSKASLETLDLHSIPFSDGELFELFEATPSLTSLTIKEAPNDPICGETFESLSTYLMEKLTYRSPSPPTPSSLSDQSEGESPKSRYLLPKLEHLTLEALKDWKDHSFESMLESRTSGMDGVAKMQSICLKLIGKEYLDVKRVRKLRDEGLKVHVSFPSKPKAKG
ncbi:hypothetical protein WG66_010166 [Moniliophthora roreri]|uniref:Uncharacterized protein n=1 Tax=Moniliophthora roreri TaxID=221103 RepID=A0A0W0FMJ1_MONRR|nr:hypothetical protein WG66_010166 [Moniliophthora roreri]